MLTAMRRLVTVTAAIGLVAALTACGSSQPDEETPTPTQAAQPETRRAAVDWEKYPDDYQRIIDEDTAAKDCQALQDTFDAAPDDAKLLRYIDEALTQADCY